METAYDNYLMEEKMKEKKEERKKEHGVLKFTEGTEKKFLDYILDNAQDNPDSVIEWANKFCWNNHWMMHVGDEKGKILEFEVKNKNPKNVLELGSYCGYSTILILKNMSDPISKVYSIDPDIYTRENITKPLLQKAGLLDRVIFIGDYSFNAIKNLPSIKFDLVFFDHDKKCYYSDLLLLEQLNLLDKQVKLIADNVIVFNIKKYYDYVRTEKFKTQVHYTNLEFNCDKDEEIYKDGVVVSEYV
jgi:catechol O-methyltransferase